MTVTNTYISFINILQIKSYKILKFMFIRTMFLSIIIKDTHFHLRFHLLKLFFKS